ncbi:hypothetical protein QYE76_050192 [Lolium multiflorum]|uniref:NB-ARC domain-containing protein n=1 Tax=Lolium multiflorum TaxID=4521 RepID=A0AAD8WIZ7_LOLMU|nr:hypothetical protein QYE76_050192 [Lolium multiflorum]
MDAIVSAVLGDILSRSISFFVDRYRRLQTGGAEESLQHLRLVLLRVRDTVEEAERRHVTNQAMLRQLETLRHSMYRGYYALDAFTCRDGEDQVSYHSLSVSKFSSAKRLCRSTSWTPNNMVVDGELRKAVVGLEMIVADMEEFVIFLKCYPPIYRQPCSSYLFSDMCMFGRQTEYERIVSFLLQIALPVTSNNLSVLPIVGPGIVGKSTLVEHVCFDERVRGFFSTIVFVDGDDLEATKPDANPVHDNGVIKYRNCGASHGRLLVIMELTGDLEEETWRQLCSSLLAHMAHGSKIIVTSRSERILRFGTAQPLRLNFLPQEAYWYFFKMIALRNAGSEDYPELSYIAMEIATELNASFAGAKIIGTLLRANTSLRFWRKVLERFRQSTAKHLHMFGEHPMDLLRKERPMHIWGMTGSSSKALVLHRCYQVRSPQKEVPRLTMHDMLCGRAIPRGGNFEFLAWKSQIPPYYSYLVSCSITTSQSSMGAKKKRSRLQGI